MRIRLCLVIALLLNATGEVTADTSSEDSDALPSGRFGVKAGTRGGSGRYDFGIGFTAAVFAGYHPTRLDQRVSFGAEWSASWSFFEFNDTASITGSVRLLEFDAGARMRVRPTLGKLRFLMLGAGVLLSRANVPIPPDSQRSYVGPYASIGLEPKVGDVSLGFEVRYGMLVAGPRTLTLSVIASVGK